MISKILLLMKILYLFEQMNKHPNKTFSILYFIYIILSILSILHFIAVLSLILKHFTHFKNITQTLTFRNLVAVVTPLPGGFQPYTGRIYSHGKIFTREIMQNFSNQRLWKKYIMDWISFETEWKYRFNPQISKFYIFYISL